MKILMLTSELDVGGAETHVETLCRALKAKGHEVCAASRGGRVAERMARDGTRHILLKNPSKNPISLLKAQKQIYEIIKEETPDVVHAHSRQEACFASVACFFLRVPCVTTAHAMFSMTPLKSRLSRWGEGTVAVSEDIKKHLIRRGRVDADKITVIENGVFVPCASEGRSRDGYNILFVSRMDGDCSLGAHLLCEIAPRLYEKYPNVRITLAGGGGDLEAVSAKAERTNRQVGHRIINAVGRIDEPSSLFACADVFVGVSRAALEAMAAGLPVILLGNEGFSGLLTEKKLASARKTNFCARGGKSADADALFASLDEFFSLPRVEKTELSRFCRETVEKYYSAESMAQKTLDFYKRIIGERKGLSQNSTKKILLCGYFGFENLGDDAILHSILKKLKPEENGFEISFLGSKRSATACKSADRVGFFSLPSIVREMRNTDVFVFGGGSLLQNKTSNRSLSYYLFLITLARKYCKRTVMLANGMGPIKDEKYRRAALAAVNSFDLISVRDTRTLKFLRKALPRRKIFLFPDPALLVGEEKPSQDAEERSQKFQKCGANKSTSVRCAESSEKKYFAVCLCGGELRRRGISPQNAADALCALSKALRAEPYFLVMNRRADLDFTESAARLLSKASDLDLCAPDGLPSPRAPKIFCPESAYSAQKILTQAELSVCMRYHASLFSALSGKPTLSLGSDSKLRALSSDLSLFPALSPSLLSDSSALLSAVNAMLASHEKNKLRTQRAVRQMRALCGKRFDDLINYFNTLDFGK